MTVIRHKDKLLVEVGEASVSAGLLRQNLMKDARQADGYGLDKLLLYQLTYPDVVAAVVRHSGFKTWPVSFEAWLSLPEAFVDKWTDATYQHNPHWLPPKQALDERMRDDANELQKRLVELAKQRKQAEQESRHNVTPELPDKLLLHDLETSYKVWQRMEATGWNFPPSVLMNEPDWLINDLLTIRGQNEIVRRMIDVS